MTTPDTTLTTEASTSPDQAATIADVEVNSDDFTPPALPEEPHTLDATAVIEAAAQSVPMQGGSAVIAGQACDEFGTPLYNKDGSPKMKRGRKPGQKAPAKPADAMPVSIEQQVESIALDAALTSQVIIAASTKVLAGLIGPEWDITDPKEFNELHLPLVKYLESKNVSDVPPGALLLIAIGGYAARRIEHENTKTKLWGFAARAKMWVGNLVSRFW